MVNGTSPDYMHCALLGVSKLLLNLWLDSSKCRGTDHDLRNAECIIDDRIKNIQIPSEINHVLRGVREMKHWKGTTKYL